MVITTKKEVFANIDFISKTALFRGCSKDDIGNMVNHLGFRSLQYKQDTIFSEGSITANLGLIISGSIRIEHNDFWGNKSILDVAEAGGIFAEVYACIPNEPMIIDVIANEDCEILFIGAANLFEPCAVCKGQNRIHGNLGNKKIYPYLIQSGIICLATKTQRRIKYGQTKLYIKRTEKSRCKKF